MKGEFNMLILSGRMKIFASVCVLISMIMLCTTWVKFSGTMAYDFSDYQNEVSGVLNTARWFLSGDESIDMDSVEEAVNALLDGKISPKEAVSISKGFNTVIKAVGDPNGEDANLYTLFLLYRILFWVTVVSGILSIASFYKNRFQGAEETFFVCQMILAIICVVGVMYLNSDVSQKILDLTLMPCFAVLFALPIKLKCLLPIEDVIDNGKAPQVERFVQKSQEVAQNITQIVGYEKWKCKNCGNENLADSRFCAECGCERPEKTKCSSCGAFVGDNDVFCRKCGNLIKTKEDKKKSRTMTCKKCGSPLDGESLFCEHCGAKVE